jgi:hypothetical protein
MMLLFIACDALLLNKPEKIEPLPDGFGRINISMGAEEARTIFPSKVFDSYEYIFIKDKDTEDESEPQKKTPENGLFTLGAGDWNVQIKAYNDNVLAAEGSADFTLASGESKQIDIAINPTVTDGFGTFSYNVAYTAGTIVNSFTLEKLSDNTPVTVNFIPGSTGMSGSVPDLEAGFYLLSLSLGRAGLSSGTTEVVYISPNLVSEYGTERNPVIFGSSHFVPSEEGIYIGLVTFAGTIENSTYQTPILLNSTGRSNLISNINNNYSIANQSGTALYYGVHKGLENLKINEAGFPSNLMSVNLITFTDGLDLGSAAQSNDAPIEGEYFNSSSAYSSYVKDEIQNRAIAGLPITAYSVGVRGNDVSDISGFQTAIENLASPDKAYELTNFDEVQTVFGEIANGLVIEGDSKTSFNLITTTLDDGTRVRMTFDPITGTDSASAEASLKYIEGTISIIGSGTSRIYMLTNIYSTGGIDTGVAAGTSVTGSRNGTEVTFAFEDISGYEQEYQANAKQWLKLTNTSPWQYNSEYNSSGSTTTKYDKRSTVIYLVMDASQSLSSSQINTIKTAATDFIDSLYDRYNATPPPGSQVDPIAIWPIEEDVWVHGNLKAGKTDHYSFDVEAGETYDLWWNDRLQGDTTKTADITVSARYDDDTSIFSGIDSGWAPAQTFTPANDGKVYVDVSGGTGTYAVGYTARDEFSPFNLRPETEIIPLTEDSWGNGTISYSGEIDYYSFDVEPEKEYYIWWNDNRGDGSKTASVNSVEALIDYGGSLTLISMSDDSGWTTPQSFALGIAAKMYISVRGAAKGTYAVGYSTSFDANIASGFEAQPLIEEDTWQDGTMLSSGQKDWYSFDVEAGNTYHVWLNEEWPGDNTKTADVDFNIHYSDGELVDSNYSIDTYAYRSFTPTINGKVYVNVEISTSYYDPDHLGSYAVGYTVNTPAKPETVFTPLTADNWMNGNQGSNWYSFDVTAGTTYYVSLNDKNDGDGSKTGDAGIRAQYADGTSAFEQTGSAWTIPKQFTPTESSTVYVYISSTGSYSVMYSTNNIPINPDVVITPLTNNAWEDGTLSSAGQINWYSFDVESDTTYYVLWNDMSDGDGSKNDYINVIAQYANGTSAFEPTDSAWTIPKQFTPTVSGTVYVSVTKRYSSSPGNSYAIMYTTNNIPINPEAVIVPLTKDEWKDGTLSSSIGSNWYSIDVEAGNSYHIWWNDAYYDGGDGTKTAELRVSAYSDDGTNLLQGDVSGWSSPHSVTPNENGTIYVRVEANFLSTIGTYAIVYTTIPLNPETVITPLNEGEWLDGMSSSEENDWYSFDVEEGKTYYIWCNSGIAGDGSMTAYVVGVRAQYTDGTLTFNNNNLDSWSSPKTFTSSTSGKVYVEMLYISDGEGGGFPGTYAVVYNTTGLRPLIE